MNIDIFVMCWVLIFLVYLLRNFIHLVTEKPKTIIDFMMSDEELGRFEKAERATLTAERDLSDLENFHLNLQQLAKTTRKNKDGTFDRRGQNGKLLNQELPGMPGKINSQQKKLLSFKKEVKKYKNLYDRKKVSWIKYKSLNYAFHRSFFVAILFLFMARNYQNMQSEYLIWISVLQFFIIKLIYSNKMTEEVDRHEKIYNIRAYIP